MSTEETAWQAGESAASVLGPEADLFASADAAGLGASTLAVLRACRAEAWRDGDRGAASLDQPFARRAGGRGSLAGRGRAAAGSGASWGQAVRRPGVDGQPGVLRAAPGPPGRVPLVAEVLAAGAGDPVDRR